MNILSCTDRMWSTEEGKGKPLQYSCLENPMKVKVKSCPILCDTVDCSPPGSSVHGILQARILEWAAIPFSRGDLPDPGIEPGSTLL